MYGTSSSAFAETTRTATCFQPSSRAARSRARPSRMTPASVMSSGTCSPRALRSLRKAAYSDGGISGTRPAFRCRRSSETARTDPDVAFVRFSSIRVACRRVFPTYRYNGEHGKTTDVVRLGAQGAGRIWCLGRPRVGEAPCAKRAGVARRGASRRATPVPYDAGGACNGRRRLGIDY